MSDMKGLRIVVAEDDDLNLFIIMKVLKDAGHIGVEFPDGHLAWEYLSAHPHDVDMVVLDKMMVQMHGLEVVRLMKEHEVLKHVPIIIQSGDAYQDKIDEAFAAGIDRYITKPFENELLLEVIQELAFEYNLGGLES